MSTSKTKPFRHLRTLLTLVLVLLALPAQARVEALLSQKSTQLDQPVRLTLQTDADQEINPDLSSLEKDFEILGRSTQQSISVVNGKMSSKRALILTLLPRREGNLVIPSLSIGSESTNALSLDVSPQGKISATDGDSQVLMELSVNKPSAFIEEAVILTLKTYLAPGVRGEQVEIPQSSLDDTQIKLINEDSYTAVRDGVEYRVVEQTFALYAYQAGSLSLSPAKFRGRSGKLSRSPFRSLFSDDLLFPRESGRIVRAESNGITLNIKPVPETYQGKQWLPARNLQIVENGLDNTAPITAGHPLTRKIMLLADGLMSSQLPEINTHMPEGIKVYPERPQLHDNTTRSGISGSLQQNLTLIATEPGQYHLPAIEIPWWNTETQQQEIARLPERDVEFLPNPGATTAPPAQAAEPIPDLAAETDSADVRNPPLTQDDSPRKLAWGLGLAWFATLIAWWLSHRRKTSRQGERQTAPDTSQPSGPDQQVLVQHIEDAYRKKDPEAARTAWLAWAHHSWPDNPPNNLARLCRRCDPKLSEAVTALEKALYSPTNQADWSTYPVMELLQSDRREISSRDRANNELIPLNP
ncbi:MAG: BatD family protein [Candidatus Thiodiazotropha sp.]